MNLETTHYWRWSHGDLTWWNLKLKTLKTMGTPRKIDAILLNIKTNRLKVVSMCRYELATYWLNFTEIYLTWVKILQKVLRGGLLFWLTHSCYFRKSLRRVRCVFGDKINNETSLYYWRNQIVFLSSCSHCLQFVTKWWSLCILSVSSLTNSARIARAVRLLLI